ncbi:Rod shape-determining protein MreD [Sinobacterium norvegicum]|uniref:Rod shape-determining protein MreD n=1 Tax=Sinobacterium norvegicum TaxID=1641715 RepID=A0ABM9ACY8_9GAMM|nr:rod shape-determining protein MreD [Sinobacterium norvegicum]CAH0991067.1 Rod shape-determining protein MreD [Sinobacterium norvegicum]
MIEAQGRWVIYGSFAIAFLLAVVPMPHWLVFARPEWLVMFLIYWVMALPHRVGVGTAFILGLLLDGLRGEIMGQNALALVVVSYICLNVYQRMRNFSLWQQAMLVFILVGLSAMIGRWVQSFGSSHPPSLHFLISAFCSAIIWPWFMVFMRATRRRFRVT